MIKATLPVLPIQSRLLAIGNCAPSLGETDAAPDAGLNKSAPAKEPAGRSPPAEEPTHGVSCAISAAARRFRRFTVSCGYLRNLSPARAHLVEHRFLDHRNDPSLLAMVGSAMAADLPRAEPPPVVAAPVGKAPIGKLPFDKGPVVARY